MRVTTPTWLLLPQPVHKREEEQNSDEGRRHSGRKEGP